MASNDVCGSRLYEALCLILNCTWMCAGAENSPEIGLIIDICVKAPVRFNGLDIFQN